jgi:hypothetical protein
MPALRRVVKKGGLRRPIDSFQDFASTVNYSILTLSTWMESPLTLPVTAT